MTDTDPVPVPPPLPPARARKRALLEGAGLGALYAVAIYAVFFKYHVLPTLAFLVLVPAAMGAVPQLIADEDQIDVYRTYLMRPWLGVLGFLVATGVIFREAAVCMVVLALPFLAVSAAAAFFVWAFQARKLQLARRKKAALLLALLPLLWVPIERAWLMPVEEREERSAIRVEAPPDAVWSRLAQVERIDADEYPAGVFTWLGVPRPIRATCDRAEVGAARVGEFEYGLRFDEVITVCEPAREMTFSIAVDPATLREGSAERHAFETGYFRFRDASYRLAPAGGATVLTLSSRYTIRSGWNAYGRLWARALVADFQERVLKLLKARIERDRTRVVQASRR